MGDEATEKIMNILKTNYPEWTPTNSISIVAGIPFYKAHDILELLFIRGIIEYKQRGFKYRYWRLHNNEISISIPNT